jgi:putative membrane protein
MMYWHGHGGWWGAEMLVMGLFWFALLALAAWAVVRFTRAPNQPAGGDLESARRILDRRYAAGEIDTEKYAEMRRVLEGRGVDTTEQ